MRYLINRVSPINSNQSNQSIKTVDQTSASFERFRSCFLSLGMSLKSKQSFAVADLDSSGIRFVLGHSPNWKQISQIRLE